jgi:hypothetical protein
MSWFRRFKSESVPAAPREQLWRDFRELFDDERLEYAGPDIGFDGLSDGDVVRVWDYVRARATSVDGDVIVWDRNREEVDEPPPLDEAVAQLARGELGYIRVALVGVESHEVLLPDLRFEFWADAVSMYWWVGSTWTASSVAAFAELLGELHALVPHAQPAYEGPNIDDFWGPVKRYLESMRSS